MDHIDGGSLNDLRTAGVEPIRALRLSAEACRALDVLHEHDIIHRDVTPGNLLLSRDPNGETRVLVADLGVAKSMIDAVGATMTAGTPSYMAPEQAGGRVPLDRRADIYSLTAVAYAMLTGKPPFPVKSIADILGRDPAIGPEPIATRLGAPASLDGVMIAGLASDRNRRPPTALVLAEGLETIAQQMESGPRPVAPPSWAESSQMTHPAPSVPHPPPTPQRFVSPAPAYPVASAPTPSPAFTGSPTPAAVSGVDPYASSMVFAEAAPPASGRRASYYVLLSVATLALFAISMFVTILVLR
jgi:serine/threonine protein kinase